MIPKDIKTHTQKTVRAVHDLRNPTAKVIELISLSKRESSAQPLSSLFLLVHLTPLKYLDFTETRFTQFAGKLSEMYGIEE